MQHSTDRIRTTHVGSLPRPPALLDLMKAAAQGHAVDPAELAETERRAVADVVARRLLLPGHLHPGDPPDDRVGQVRGAGRGSAPGHRPALVIRPAKKPASSAASSSGASSARW